ncbi:MAG: LysR family transcriptional regulator [Burkholderiales bacterium]
MEFRDLDYFLHAAAAGHIGRAASEIGLTQPALTKSIARLERQLNARLFERTARGVRLTEAGERLSSHALRLRAGLDDAKRELAELSDGRRGHLRIGAGLTMAQHLVPRACARLVADLPGVSLEISTGTGDTLMPALRNGTLDLVVTGVALASDPDLKQEVIAEDDVRVVARRLHPLFRTRKPTIRHFMRERWILPRPGALLSVWLAARCRDLGSEPPRPAVVSDSMPALLSIVAHSNLLSFQALSAVQHSPLHDAIRSFDVDGLIWRRRIGVTYRRSGYLPASARTLITLLRSAATGVQQD